MKIYLYDPKKSVSFHMEHGPLVDDITFEPSLKKGNFTFLNKKVSSLFGAPAFVLTMDSRWTTILSRLGYDIITYKTVRSRGWPANAHPNWMYVDIPMQLSERELDIPVIGSFEPLRSQEISTANSFGVPSQKPELWQQDFEIAKKNLREGQMMILSLMCSPIEGKTLVDDAETLGKLAIQTTADAFEINFACPNTDSHGLIYEDVTLTIQICKKLKEVLGDRPLLAKVGYYKDPESLKRFIKESQGLISGISSTNTFSMKVVDTEGNSAFGEKRSTAGVAGGAIRNLAIKQIDRIMEYKKEMGQHDLVVLAIGGVTEPRHIQEYLDKGVNAVQGASAVWQNPYIARQYKEKYL
ncbi:diguanylate cyclase [soil metagenome]